jgi:hypothetical protein
LRKIFRIQSHNKVGPTSFGTGTKRIIAGIGRDIWQFGDRYEFRFLAQQIDDFANE